MGGHIEGLNQGGSARTKKLMILSVHGDSKGFPLLVLRPVVLRDDQGVWFGPWAQQVFAVVDRVLVPMIQQVIPAAAVLMVVGFSLSVAESCFDTVVCLLGPALVPSDSGSVVPSEITSSIAL